MVFILPFFLHFFLSVRVPVFTILPKRPLEGSRVILAPCSPIMSRQQRWSFPKNSSAPLRLLLQNNETHNSDPAMYLHLQHGSRNPLAVVRSGADPPLWEFNSSLDVLQLASTRDCLTINHNGRYSNLVPGPCPERSWRSNTKDLSPGGGDPNLFRNATDSTIRFVWRDAYNLNRRNFSVCLTSTWGEPCENVEFRGLPFCDRSLPAGNRTDDLLSRATLDELQGALSNDQAHHPWLARLGFVPNNTHQEALHGACASGGAPAQSRNVTHGTGFGTSFPHEISLAASLNRSLWAQVGLAIATESRALSNQGVGGLYLRTPNLNMARDPRWGRLQEVGEFSDSQMLQPCVSLPPF